MNHGLSHFNEQREPQMVDVSGKNISHREALASGAVIFTDKIWAALQDNGFSTSKGPISDVARIAGTMAVKRTADWIPFCHTLPVDGCQFTIEPDAKNKSLRIQCRVMTTARTGVEMEALTGVSAAALTIYDMTKSLGYGIRIEEIMLQEKTGGKAHYKAG